MAIYSIKNRKLSFIEEIAFKLEKEIQKTCEDNLEQLFGLQIIRSQFTFQNFRIDTLAFDQKPKSFVVIEYKRDKNFSVIDQGYAYLSLLLNNKADFILEYNENCKAVLRKNDIDWSQTKIIFISPSFTHYQVQSINFKDLPIELWEIKKYANDTVNLEQIRPLGATESIKTISKGDKLIEGVSKEVKVYTEDDHLAETSDEIKELYDKFKISLLTISGDIKIKPTKWYMGFLSKTNFVDIHIQKKALKIWLNLRSGELDDPKGLARDVSKIGHWGNGDYEIQVSNDENIDYIISLAKQSFRKNSL
ncbi:MAG: hypothetical protein A2X87_01055 [Deltaproteobacteria bacterium GWC2_42_51]|nr:MAG: hypothetical protein A2328_00110 [Bdellovibrionales bacterium RIFOXYB2_FULL_36_6]OGP10663.1 MAG: hypothetical protein A2056_03395 [Deltaproteobacteria bacterium GWA2_42_85]OGP34532.1 MAG: hypothetical protein A2X87_01055 [Deltaproteobacteria bacterium GWC2_42_51]OGP44075.1 MAG: hypothetical protein A2090_06155 [Deltaproteobacteria bacterium GWD2_42_10]OGP46717.1 MAG: hypothetical protein A2022_05330 [Deltaproteobacteria bacterium GWF2_42_12]OGQ26867.1 MAG: hypothetical protein A3D29_05